MAASDRVTREAVLTSTMARLSVMERQTVSLVDVSDKRDDTYRAIGRYVVAFSQMVVAMREILAGHITPERESRLPVDLLASSLTAQQIADPFFAVCRSLVELDDDEEAIARKLQKSVSDEIEERNAFAHHDWHVARWSTPDVDVPIAERLGLKASSKKSAERRVVYTPADIDKLARRVEGLRNVVWEFGTICTKQDAYDPAKGRPVPSIKKSLRISEEGVVIYFEGEHFVPFQPHGHEPDA